MHAVLRDEADAYRYLEHLRWGGTPATCPHCGTSGRCYFLCPADGRSRPTRTGAPSARRVWKCGACRRQFSVLTGTILEGTRIGVLIWLGTIALASADVSVLGKPADLADRFAVHPESARHLAARLSAALSIESVASWRADRTR